MGTNPYCVGRCQFTGGSLATDADVLTCAWCRAGLRRDLRALAELYDRDADRAAGRAPAPAVLYLVLVAVLASWCQRVTGDGEPAPTREIGPLIGFLVARLDRLMALPEAGEIPELITAAGRARHPNPMRRISYGRCRWPGCDRTVFATVRAGVANDPPRASCAAGHVWPSRPGATHRFVTT
ncbi:MAG TPA: hypothetical protein VJX10_16455 [Pseudonocardiaceae bacterium]|nr:hypothetical protein [Pseudonocardiaceae bacterium]